MDDHVICQLLQVGQLREEGLWDLEKGKHRIIVVRIETHRKTGRFSRTTATTFRILMWPETPNGGIFD